MWAGTAMKCVLMVVLCVVFQAQTGKRHHHRQVRKNTFKHILDPGSRTGSVRSYTWRCYTMIDCCQTSK